jgi:hypothetical protein
LVGRLTSAYDRGVLRPCPRCARHVRADEADCPFCRRPLVFALAFGLAAAGCGEPAQPRPKDPAAEMSRSGCREPTGAPVSGFSERDVGDGGANDYGPGFDDDPLSAGGLYGAPPPDDAPRGGYAPCPKEDDEDDD